jgi:PAS domain S-box-containing protein
MAQSLLKSMLGFSGLPAVTVTDQKVSPADARKRVIRLIVACSILFACVVIVGTAVVIGNLRARTLAGTERELRNMALLLAEQSARSFEALALVESGLVQRMDKLGITSAAELRDRMSGYDAHVMLRDTVNGLPHVESIAVIDPRGNIVNFSRFWPIPSVNIADRAYFKALTTDRYMTTALSEPIRNRTTGTWSIYLARKFSAPNGELIGIITGALERRYIEQFFNKINRGPGSTISLVRRDGVLLASDPPQNADERAPVQNKELNAALAQPGQNVARISGADGEERLIAIQDVPNYPLRISVTTTTSAALAGWANESIYLIGAAGLIVLIIAGATFVVVRQIYGYSAMARERANVDVDRKATELVLRETERVHKQLNNQKIQLDTVLDNMLQGVIMLDADSRMLVCNKRYIEIYGLSPDVVKPGCTLRELIQHRVDIGNFTGNVDETVRKILDAIAEGKPSSLTFQLTDGRLIAVFTQPMADGGVVATHQDVTDQRRAEREADRAQRFLLTVIENVPSTVVVKDVRDQKYVLINRAGEKFYGLPRSKVVGRTPHELFPKASADLIVSHDQTLLQSQSEVSFGTHALETPANGRRLVTAKRLAIRDANGSPQFLLSVIDDVTDRKPAS